MTKPSLFISSSSEALEIARAIKANLAADAEVTVWDEDFFELNKGYVESLVRSSSRFDFALLILSADDIVLSRDAMALASRDNVTFELGFFIGRLRRHRTFIVCEENENLKLPSNLAGIRIVTYEANRSDNNVVAAVGTACFIISQRIKRLGAKRDSTNGGNAPARLPAPADAHADEEHQPPHSPHTVYQNLPQPTYSEFVGRLTELELLSGLLSANRRDWVISITGVGGIGKTALALKIARHYALNSDLITPRDRFDAVIWASAKTEALTDDGILLQRPSLRALNDIYTTIAWVLQRQDITRAHPRERNEVVRNALTQKRVLLVIDNLETIKDDEDIRAFLSNIPFPTKVIVTTRYRIDVLSEVRLDEMSWEDAETLIKHEGARKGVTLSEGEAGLIYKRMGGIPIAIVWGIARIGMGYSVESVTSQPSQHTTDVARYCFESSIDSIRHSRSAYSLLLALALFARDANAEALGVATGIDESWLIEDGLVILQRLSLINRKRDRYSILPLTRSYVKGKLERTPGFTEEAYKRLLLYYVNLLTPPEELKVGGHPYWSGLRNYPSIHRLEKEAENLIGFTHWLLGQERNDDALELFLLIIHLLVQWGVWDERLEISLKMCEVTRSLDDSTEVWLWLDAIAWIYIERKQLAECLEALNRGRELARRFGIADALILADTFEAEAYLRVGDRERARGKIEPVVGRINLDSINEYDDVLTQIVNVRAIERLAELNVLDGGDARARELYETSLNLRYKIREDTAPPLVQLIKLGLPSDDIASVEKYLSGEHLAHVEKTAGKTELGWINYCLALIYEKKGEVREALIRCQDALDQFEVLELEQQIRDAGALLSRLEKAAVSRGRANV